jgi:hypothetical protein
MDVRTRLLFLALISAQAMHSVEEFVFRLYDVLAPARAISEAVGFGYRPLGFLVFNAAVLSFGFWCWIARVRPGLRGARGIVWFWALLEIANGLGHIALAIAVRGYFPGLATACLLLPIGLALVGRQAHGRAESG